MHLNIPESLLRDRAAREHRNRIWWTAYIFDRTWSSKLGHPVSVHDNDFNVDPPSADGLTADDDFGDYEYALQNIELARLTGRIVPLLYGRRKQTKPFSQRVQQALTELTKWVENLPGHLQLHRGDKEMTIPSNMIYLHLTFNQVRSLVFLDYLIQLTNSVRNHGDEANLTSCLHQHRKGSYKSRRQSSSSHVRRCTQNCTNLHTMCKTLVSATE